MSPSSPRLHSCIGALLLACTLVACGPVSSTSQINAAEASLEAARIANAHQRAPYEYYTAKSYLYKAKEEWGYSDFEASKDYAARAERAARSALSKSGENPYEGSPVPQAKLNEARLNRAKNRTKADDVETMKGSTTPEAKP